MERNSKTAVMDMSRLQPQAVEFEEIVLGAMMIESSAVDKAINVLKIEHFYKDAHQHIFECITSLRARQAPIDIVTVAEELRIYENLDNVGGVHYIGDLTDKASGSYKMEFYIEVILEKSLKRQIIALCSEAGSQSFDEASNPFEIISDINSKLSILRNTSSTSNTKALSQIVVEQILRMEEERRGVRTSNLVSYEIKDLNRACISLCGGDLIVIGARPSMGKSALAMSMAKKQAAIGIPVGFFSMEMKDRKLMERIFSQETGITPKQQMDPKSLSEEDMEKLKSTNLNKLPLYLNDTGGITIAQIEGEARRMVKNYGVRVIYIDYLQLVKGVVKRKFENKTAEVSEVSNKLKQLAMELDIPIIALAQLGRAVDETRDKRPLLSHLRQSGEIEQDADVIIFLMRPEYYKMLDKKKNPIDEGKGILIIRKNRQGALRDVKIGFNGPKIEFYDLEDGDYDYDNYAYKEDSMDSTLISISEGDDDLPF